MELTRISDRLLATSVIGLGRLAAVSHNGSIPVTGTLVLETNRGFITLSYTQQGLSVRGPEQRSEIRWTTEPDLTMDHQAAAEEWLELIAIEDRPHTTTLPLAVDTVTGWFGLGPWVDTFAILLTGGDRTLVLTTTDEFDLTTSTPEHARQRAKLAAANMNLRFTEQVQSL
ncbi:hypothetical protein [Nocardia seriolae]|uniref:hypothetical protein n=1 Tax=Nocardia seriolae TaxID=37332 RepID=UPI0004AFA482|nr:hypothetical protein [Nocardia seriolae]MTJ62253.1 hypothetical protein [Nocardia seriolae]MTJ75781.1 hypothetical protein [Nocardia seriolae]MTJ87160.1 hypothetical protein [Nocardia seriolae]MTK31154.1 hypothetical protein [Nocardia seriolae]MTK40204.1 hypothetical protein [Nocardia seriolae]